VTKTKKTTRKVQEAVPRSTKLADLTYDVPFKHAFHDPETLKHLLNGIFAATDGAGFVIVDVESIDDPSRGGSPASKDRTVLYDIVCTLKDGTKAIVEMQRAPQRADIGDRLIGYLARDYSSQWVKGKNHSNLLLPVRVVAFLGFTLLPEKNRSGPFIQNFFMQPAPNSKATATLQKRFKDLTNITLVQLPLAPHIDDAHTDAEKWAVLIRDAHLYTSGDLPPQFLESPFNTVTTRALESSLSKAEWKDYAQQLLRSRQPGSFQLTVEQQDQQIEYMLRQMEDKDRKIEDKDRQMEDKDRQIEHLLLALEKAGVSPQ
jgi:hypothetical protein